MRAYRLVCLQLWYKERLAAVLAPYAEERLPDGVLAVVFEMVSDFLVHAGPTAIDTRNLGMGCMRVCE